MGHVHLPLHSVGACCPANSSAIPPAADTVALQTDFFIIAPTLYLYIVELGGDRSFQGAVLSAFFIGKLVAAPVVAAAADRYGNRIAFVLSMLVAVAGNAAYAFATNKWWVLGSRIVAGLGAGGDGVTIGYVSRRLPATQATRGMLALRMGFGLGQVTSPALSYLISKVGPKVGTNVWLLRLDVYTIPSLVTAAMCLGFLLFAVRTIVEDDELQQDDGRSHANSEMTGVADDKSDAAVARRSCWTVVSEASPDRKGAVLLMTTFSMAFMLTGWVAVNVPVINANFGWDSDKTSLAGTAAGCVSLASATSLMKVLGTYKVDDRKLFLGSAAMSVLGALTLSSTANTDAPFSGKVQLWQYVVGLSVMTFFGTWAIAAVGGAFRKLRSSVSNLYMSMYTGSNNIARISAPFIGGFLHPSGQPGNPDMEIFVSAGFVLVVFLLFLSVYGDLLPAPPAPATEDDVGIVEAATERGVAGKSSADPSRDSSEASARGELLASLLRGSDDAVEPGVSMTTRAVSAGGPRRGDWLSAHEGSSLLDRGRRAETVGPRWLLGTTRLTRHQETSISSISFSVIDQ